MLNALADILLADQGQSSVPIYAVPAKSADAWAKEQSASVQAWLKSVNFRGESQRLVYLPGADGTLAGVVLGLGPDEDAFPFAGCSAHLPSGVYRIAHAPARHAPAHVAYAWALGTYAFSRYKRNEPRKDWPQLVTDTRVDRAEVARIAEGVFLARDLVNLPSNDMGPAELEAAARDLASRHDAKARVVVGAKLVAENYPMIHTVGAASVREPRLIDLTWGDADAPKVTLVGKGVCFDSGGLDLKPSSAMLTMKKDMGGAAAMLGLAHMIMGAKLNVRLRVLIPAVENSVAGNAYRPGDVIRSRKGLTVEIGNTDAEGRLVLADALADADAEKPALILNMATLTGAARSATGFELPPFFTDDEALAADLARISLAEHDHMWRLPMWKPYESWIEGKVAQLTNAADSSYAGAITAALFLKRFVTETPSFAHFDVAAWVDRAKPGRPLGGEAHCIRALYALIKERFGSKTA